MDSGRRLLTAYVTFVDMLAASAQWCTLQTASIWNAALQRFRLQQSVACRAA